MGYSCLDEWEVEYQYSKMNNQLLQNNSRGDQITTIKTYVLELGNYILMGSMSNAMQIQCRYSDVCMYLYWFVVYNDNIEY